MFTHKSLTHKLYLIIVSEKKINIIVLYSITLLKDSGLGVDLGEYTQYSKLSLESALMER
jgi:hypothetical protein